MLFGCPLGDQACPVLREMVVQGRTEWTIRVSSLVSTKPALILAASNYSVVSRIFCTNSIQTIT